MTWYLHFVANLSLNRSKAYMSQTDSKLLICYKITDRRATFYIIMSFQDRTPWQKHGKGLPPNASYPQRNA